MIRTRVRKKIIFFDPEVLFEVLDEIQQFTFNY